MSDLDHARQMLAIAHRDLKALGGMLDSDIFAYEIFGFHAQQTAEKALKAWIAALAGIPGRVGNRFHPAPPHQAVRAVFPHTAFRCSSL